MNKKKKYSFIQIYSLGKETKTKTTDKKPLGCGHHQQQQQQKPPSPPHNDITMSMNDI